jgi:hypothetical protein
MISRMDSRAFIGEWRALKVRHSREFQLSTQMPGSIDAPRDNDVELL